MNFPEIPVPILENCRVHKRKERLYIPRVSDPMEALPAPYSFKEILLLSC